MLRWGELLLTAAPVLAFLSWRLLLARGVPFRTALLMSVAGLFLFGAVLYAVGNQRALQPGVAYVPAVLRDGQVLPGHAAPRPPAP